MISKFLKSKLCVAVLLATSSMAAQAIVISEAEPNNSFATAQNLDPYFSLDFSANIGNFTSNTSTTIPHVSIQGSGDNNQSYDYYSFTTTGGLAIFDIDTTSRIDSYLHLFDSLGNSLLENDDNIASYGQGGSAEHYGLGSNFSLDSYIQTTLLAGSYFIRVGSCCEQPLFSGNYELQVSLENHPTNVPEPASLALLGLGFAGMRMVRSKTA